MQFEREHLDVDAADLDLGHPDDRACTQHVDVLHRAPYGPRRAGLGRRRVPQRPRIAHELAVVAHPVELVVAAVVLQAGAGRLRADHRLVPPFGQRAPGEHRPAALVAHGDRRLCRVVVVATVDGVDRLAAGGRVRVHAGGRQRRPSLVDVAGDGPEVANGLLDVDRRCRFPEDDRRGDEDTGDEDDEDAGSDEPAPQARPGGVSGAATSGWSAGSIPRFCSVRPWRRRIERGAQP